MEDTTRNVLLMSGRDYRLLCFDLTQMRFVRADGMTFPKTNDEEKTEQRYLARARELGIDRGNRTDRRHDLHYARLDDGQEIFATIDNGFFVYEPKSRLLQHYCSTDDKPIIESDYINGLVTDRSNGVWLPTTFAGIYRIDMGEEALHTYALAPNIRSFAQIDKQHIAVADMGGQVFSFDLHTGQSSVIFNEGVRAYALNTDRKGRLWIGTRGGGVWIKDLDDTIKKIEELPARQIYDIVFSPNDIVWIATLDGGLIEGHERADGRFVFTQHLQDEKIHELDFDSKGRLWMATESGIVRKDKQQVDTLFHKGKVVCICHAPNGTVWAGSNGYGLIKIEGNQLHFLTTDKGLANNCVEAVMVDKQGNIVAATDQGVSIINGRDGTICNIYSSDGLMADTYNENAILQTTDGRIFLGCLKGMVELKHKAQNTAYYAQNTIRPRLTCMEVNDVPRYDYLNEEIHLTHDQNNLVFCFSSFAYSDLPSVIYSYWLEGIDRGWRPSTKESRVLYTHLSPGHYQLYARCSMAGATWSDETVCDIYISQPWYWTWWIRLIYLLLIAFIVWYEWHQYQQRLSLRRQLDQRLTVLYAVEKASTSDTVVSPAPAETPSQQDETLSQQENSPTQREEPPTQQEETAHAKAANQKNKEFLDKLDHLILANLLQTDLDVHYLAQEMCVSYSTLHRRIKSLTGMTANEYVRKHRLVKAMQLLRDGHNASDVSMDCGFSSPSYFTRCFKAEYGMLPSQV